MGFIELILTAIIGGVIGYFIRDNQTQIITEVQKIETEVK